MHWPDFHSFYVNAVGAGTCMVCFIRNIDKIKNSNMLNCYRLAQSKKKKKQEFGEGVKSTTLIRVIQIHIPIFTIAYVQAVDSSGMGLYKSNLNGM